MVWLPGWCRTSWTRWYSKYPTIYYITYQQGAVACLYLCMKISYHFIFFARCWCTRGSKSQFLGIGWVSVWLSVWRVPRPGKFLKSDMCSLGACFHNFRRNRFCRKVPCSSVCYSCLQSYTCLLLIYQVKVSFWGVHRVGFHAFKAETYTYQDLIWINMKGFLRKPFCLLLICLNASPCRKGGERNSIQCNFWNEIKLPPTTHI